MGSQIPTTRIKIRTDSRFISIPNFQSEIVEKNGNTKSWTKDSFDASELVVAETKSKFIFKVLLLQKNPQFFCVGGEDCDKFGLDFSSNTRLRGWNDRMAIEVRLHTSKKIALAWCACRSRKLTNSS